MRTEVVAGGGEAADASPKPRPRTKTLSWRETDQLALSALRVQVAATTGRVLSERDVIACQWARNSRRVGEGKSPHLLASKEVPDVDRDGAARHISGLREETSRGGTDGGEGAVGGDSSSSRG